MVLTSDPATLGGDVPFSNPDPSLNYVGDKYKELRSYFSFNADGSVNGSAQNSDQTHSVALYAFRAPAVGGVAQTATQKNNVIEQYNIKTATQIVDRDGTASDVYYTSQVMPDLNKSYYLSKIGTITNVDQLVNDKRLADYVRAASRHGSGLYAAEKRSDRSFLCPFDRSGKRLRGLHFQGRRYGLSDGARAVRDQLTAS